MDQPQKKSVEQNQPPFPEPPPGKELKVPHQFVDALSPKNWTTAWLGRGRGALMLETGNGTHFTVAFFVCVSKEGLEEIRDQVVENLKKGEKERVLDVWSSVGEMWGRHSVRVGEKSALGLLQTEVMIYLDAKGHATDNRAPHIEVMKGGGRGRGRGSGRGRGKEEK